jgi:hypothetical protein
MYWMDIPPLPSKRMTEEEFMRSQDLRELGLRFVICLALFAAMITWLNLAYENKNDRPQTMTADRMMSGRTDADAVRPIEMQSRRSF